MLRVGVDIGGTFTDLMTFDEEAGTLSRTKVLTTPRAPEEGLLAACSAAGVEVEGVSHFVHGTTLVTNLVIEREGAKVGLITTRGFRDILLFQTGMREQSFDLQWERRKALVPRHLIVEVSERMGKEGNPIAPLDLDEAARAVRYLVEKGVGSVAVCLFNSYANGEHEMEVGRIVSREAPHLYVSLSCQVDPRIREYPRASTTVLNAYAMPRVYGYVERLDGALEAPGGIKYMHSGGGLISSSAARERPIALVESGPAAGVLACRYLGEKLGIGQIITADMGGTSFDVCMIRDGVPEIKDTTDVEFGIPVRSDSIDVVSIGAGGGSIAWVDEGGSLRVGPRSAGSDPGPACYGFGGTEPTTTDANMVLGTLNPDNLLGGGAIRLDPERSRQAMQPIADHFGVSVPEAAQGVYRVVNASMAQAVRQVTVKKGIDPREFTLVPFGGAGGQHAIDVAKELDITSVLFPVNASTLSALGMMTADVSYTESRTVSSPLADLSMEQVESDLRRLEARALGYLEGDESRVTGTGVQWKADVRYVGQSFELRVPLPRGRVTREQVYREFEQVYRERYGMVLGDPAEVVNLHATATGYIQPLELPRSNGAGHGAPVPKGRRKMAFYDSPVPVYDRETLRNGMVLESPCIVEEVDNTIFLPEGCVSRVDEYGNIRTTVSAAPRQESAELDPFTAEIIRSYLLSTVEEMMKSTTAAAYSSTFAERLDFTGAIFDRQGRMVAQAQGVPIHAGTMTDSMEAIIGAFEGSFEDGDVVLLNDVYAGGSHQPDVMVARPIFHDGALVGYTANRGHWTDIGGMAAGGFSGTARHVVQEALTIPPAKLYEAGVLNATVREFILRNVRVSRQIWGDIQSQIAANLTGERRVQALIDKYGVDTVLAGMDATLEYGRRRFRQKLLEMPDGEGSDHDFVDTDGYTDRMYKINVAVKKKGDRLSVDCSGSSDQDFSMVNCSKVVSKGAIFVAVISMVDPDGVMNSGVLEQIDLSIPEGSILNPHHPAPVAAGIYHIPALTDTVIRAFGDWLPNRVIGSSNGDRDNTTYWGFHPETGSEWVWYLSQSGGYGARATKDGEPVAPDPRNNCRFSSLEIWEREFPALFTRWEMVTDSGGDGKFRGGLASRQEFELLGDALYSAAATRHILPPRGIFGGGDAHCHSFHLTRDGKRTTLQDAFDLPSPSKFANVSLKRGDVFAVESGGGGGYGDPLERDVSMVERDVLEGYVSPEKARDVYGVSIDAATLKANPQETEELRRKLAAGVPSLIEEDGVGVPSPLVGEG